MAIMKRWSILLTLLFSGTLLIGQAAPGQALSSDLIAWSFMQQPQEPEQPPAQHPPGPDPAPETTPAQNPTTTAPNPRSTTPAAKNEQSAAQGQSEPAQTFMGTVSKEEDSFVLKVSDTTSYKLDNQQQVQQYEGRRVRVTGILDRALNLIHVDLIEPIS
jgi:hypothetical protein